MNTPQRNQAHQPIWILVTITGIALVFRLLAVWWHGPYPLSGDEVGFFNQARTFVQGNGFHDMPFMRAPLYPFFLAVIFRLFGAEVGAARIVQALLGTATVPLLYLWAQRRHGQRAGLIAAILAALLFSLVLPATLLLTETLFLFLFALGMVLLEWSPERPKWWRPLLVGAVFGLSALTRSIGLPLVGLAALWYALAPQGQIRLWPRLRPALLVVLGALLLILPWTARNAIVHDALILIDTTGATNLWMDNDPNLGRDAVKAELLEYPEGERQGLSMREGLRAIRENLPWFGKKCWRELRLFFSLEYFDDFLRRPAIWFPPGEVWSRVLLGDGLYLLLLAAGLVGLIGTRRRLKALDLLWLVYVPATTTLFHVELRYRLPFLLALLPHAAAVLARPRETVGCLRKKPFRALAAGLSLLALAGLLLSWANYPQLSGQILRKHFHVALGERALERGDVEGALARAEEALAAYPESTEARVLLARAQREQGNVEEAEAVLRQAIDYRSGHPHPHLLLGDLLREQGRLEEAARELAYESRSLEDLQQWAWEHFAGEVPEALDFGSGLELGHVRGWHLPERSGEGVGFRWSDERVQFRLIAPPGDGPIRMTLRLAAGRLENVSLPVVQLYGDEQDWPPFTVENGWHVYTLEVGDLPAGSVLHLGLRSDTYRPHRYDRQLDDNRPLGVMVDWVGLER